MLAMIVVAVVLRGEAAVTDARAAAFGRSHCASATIGAARRSARVRRPATHEQHSGGDRRRLPPAAAAAPTADCLRGHQRHHVADPVRVALEKRDPRHRRRGGRARGRPASNAPGIDQQAAGEQAEQADERQTVVQLPPSDRSRSIPGSPRRRMPERGVLGDEEAARHEPRPPTTRLKSDEAGNGGDGYAAIGMTCDTARRAMTGSPRRAQTRRRPGDHVTGQASYGSGRRARTRCRSADLPPSR